MEAVRSKKEERDEAKRLHLSTGRKKKQKKTRGRTTDWLTADRPTYRKWKKEKKRAISPTVGDRNAPQPWVQRSCASPAGRRMGPGPERGRAETKERRGDEEKEERDSAAPNVIMQWTGSANGGRGGMFFIFFIFQPVR